MDKCNFFTRSANTNTTSRTVYAEKWYGQADREHKCSIPSCGDKVFRDHFCWDHYQIENYTGR